jgi:hypothetical protein
VICAQPALHKANHLRRSSSPVHNPPVASLVLLNTMSPSKLADELILYGHQVWEAIALSEVLHLCEQEKVDVVLIASDVPDGELIEKQLRGRIVMRFKPNADAAYVNWELALLFPGQTASVQ